MNGLNSLEPQPLWNYFFEICQIPRPSKKEGKIKIITDEVASGGLLEVKIQDYQAAQLLIDEQLPGEFIWQNKYGIFVGDEEVLTKEEVAIVNNKSVLPPESQDMFLQFTKPIYTQLTELLSSYFSRYN